MCFQGEWRAANFKLARSGRRQNPKVKEISIIDVDSERGTVAEPPHYTESVDDVDSLHSETLSARVMTATHVRPGQQVHVELVPIYGVRYEATSDQFPRPRSD